VDFVAEANFSPYLGPLSFWTYFNDQCLERKKRKQTSETGWSPVFRYKCGEAPTVLGPID